MEKFVFWVFAIFLWSFKMDMDWALFLFLAPLVDIEFLEASSSHRILIPNVNFNFFGRLDIQAVKICVDAPVVLVFESNAIFWTTVIYGL